MRTRTGILAFVATLIAAALAGSAQAQESAAPVRTDSAPHFALFGGWAPMDGQYVVRHGFATGASGDFRLAPIPVPLRLSLSFDERTGEYISKQRGGQASLDLVMRPIPKSFGIRPYFLGGLGVATRTSYYQIAPNSPTTANFFVRPRQTWSFASLGAGLDIGRMFIQAKLDQPIASDGPVLVPINIGFRFWD